VTIHVFVETNFLVEILRPFPGPDALALSRRGDVTIHVPWVSVSEAKRTLARVINEDLGFDSPLAQLAAAEFRAGDLDAQAKPVVDAMVQRLKARRAEALRTAVTRVDEAVGRMRVIAPSIAVVDRTLGLYPIKSLPPFDEMVLGAVLARADALGGSGGRPMYFCNLNKRDFDNASLRAEYERVGLTYSASFKLPA
jgi:hypothetical protein